METITITKHLCGYIAGKVSPIYEYEVNGETFAKVFELSDGYLLLERGLVNGWYPKTYKTRRGADVRAKKCCIELCRCYWPTKEIHLSVVVDR